MRSLIEKDPDDDEETIKAKVREKATYLLEQNRFMVSPTFYRRVSTNHIIGPAN